MPYDIAKLDLFPQLPGVYIMKSEKNEVLYVGKANNLRQRVKQYFVPGRDGRPIVPFLIMHVEQIEIIIVTSEKEALLLENNLIKQHQPKYNALLKDDKTFIALKVTTKDTWPTVQLVRYRGKPKADGLYFGPYTSAHAARTTLETIHKVFPLRQCSNQELNRRTRPCILYQMKRCIAPCVLKCTKEEYFHQVDRTIKFLKGQDKEVLEDLSKEMQNYADQLAFEKAGHILRIIRQIEKTIESQKVDKPFGLDIDAWSVFREAEEVVICQLIFRSGTLTGTRHYEFSHIAQDDEELFASFLLQQYGFEAELPHEILLPVEISEANIIEEILSTNRKRKVNLYKPQRGEKKALVEMAYQNAKAAFEQKKDKEEIREKILMQIQEKFHLNQYPARIECFDNSNLSGSEPVSALVAFSDGKKDSSRYRKYKIKSAYSSDDYEALREVLARRYSRAKEEGDLPDLLIIDGGKGHLNVALKVFEELNIITVNLISLAKEEGRHDKGLSSEQVFLPNIKDPIFLPRTSPILFLLQQIRDEAHRFAITFQRKRTQKKSLSSVLDQIPGIGPVKKKALLTQLGSLKKIKESTEKELEAVKGITKENAQTILHFFSKINL